MNKTLYINIYYEHIYHICMFVYILNYTDVRLVL